VLKGGKPGKTLLIRADMDALPIEEETGLEFRSQNAGKMHACGHDGHTSILLTTARILARRREELPGTVVFCFQPAEEGGGGARAMMADGIMENPTVDGTIGLHLWQGFPIGDVVVVSGAAMSGANGYHVTIQGQGGHGAMPHATVDALLVAATIVSNLQVLVSREVDPLKPVVVTIGSLHAGTAANIIADTAEFRGTTRFFDAAVGEYVAARFPQLVEQMAASFRAKAMVEYRTGGQPVMNDPHMADLVRDAAAAVVGVAHVKPGPPLMPSEDYSEFTARVPGCYFFVGSHNKETGQVWDHHHPKFDFDERALSIGVEVMVGAALRYLNENAG
ncbi:MAG: amidohydrolase, partial [Thermomicrobia bacterium]|nr:amidohydrolase [Thermomicrobia bacterium]